MPISGKENLNLHFKLNTGLNPLFLTCIEVYILLFFSSYWVP